MLVLDSNCVYYKVQETSAGIFDKILTLNLAKYPPVKQLVEKMEPFETISMTERTLTSKKKVINIFSGNCYDLLDKYGEDLAGPCQPITHSNKILHTLKNKKDESIELAVTDEPGSRSFGNIGTRGWKSVRNFFSISEETYLIQFEQEEKEYYWTMQHNGLAKKIPEALSNILNKKKWSQVCACIVLGKITKVLLLQIPENEDEDPEYEVKVMYLSESGKVLD